MLCGFNAEVGEPVEPGRQVPVAPAKDLHAGGNENGPHQGSVQENGDGKPEAHLLVDGALARGKGPEDGDHDESGAGDNAGGGPEAIGYGLGVVTGLVIALPDAAEEEDVVIHGEAEEDGKEEKGIQISMTSACWKPNRSAPPFWNTRTMSP